MKVCPTLHTREEIEPGFFMSPVALPLRRSLESCLGRFNDPKRAGYNPLYKWHDDGVKIGHQGNDLAVDLGASVVAMADGIVAYIDYTDNYNRTTKTGDAAGVWMAVLHKCPECPGWFLTRYLHLMTGTIVVKVGQHVVKGQKLARGDTTGSASWSHVHLDLLHWNNPDANKAATYGPSWGIPYDPQAWHILSTGTTPTPAPITLVAIAVDKPLLREGASGTAVVELQAVLNTRFGATLATDGKFGPMTKAGVITFQASKGLVQDGVVGKNTWSALEDY